MKARFAALLCAILLLPATTASADFDMLAGVGLNMCQDSGDLECKDVDPDMSLLLAPGVKLGEYLALYLDFQYGMLTRGDTDATTLHAMPTVRGTFDLGGTKVFGGAGLGYSSFSTEQGNSEVSWSGWLNFKVTIGGAYTIMENLSVGANIDYVINMNETGEACLNDECADNEADVLNLLQVSAIVKLSF